MSVITSQSDLDSICADIAQQDFMTVDTEFLREKTYYPKLCLVQFSGAKGEAYALDPVETDLDWSPFYDLMFNQPVVKVFHAARQDLEIFFQDEGKIPQPFFDTQIAAMVCGYGDSIGYDNLVRQITGTTIDKGPQFTNWAARPLSERQLSYALNDVIYLKDLYIALKEDLNKRNRAHWVEEEIAVMTNPQTYTIDPDTLWQKVKIKSAKSRNLAVLRALTAWREDRAQDKNIPRGWIIRDDTLADIATQIPQTADKLAKIRNFSADAANGKQGKAVLSIIKDTLKTAESDWPCIEKKQALPADLVPVVEMLKMLLRIQSAEHDVAARLIATQGDLDTLARTSSDPADDLIFLKGWRYDVFGKDALALIDGSLGLSLGKGKIRKIEI